METNITLGFDIHRNQKELAKAEIEAITKKRGSIKNKLYLVKTPYKKELNNLAFTRAIYNQNKKLIIDLNKHNQFQQRRAHLLPEGNPGMTHPRVARAMINLANAKTILDPFCGAGGILIEAALIKKKAIGFDIDKIMINRTKQNVKHLKLKNITAKQKDATTLTKKDIPNQTVIVTDLPYGKTTKVTKELTQLYTDFLTNIKRNNIKTAVIGFPSTVRHKPLIKKAKLKIKQEFTYYLHKTLSKKIVVITL
jgi:tRNA (guanine10-N2)-dimethyltransferase